MTDKRQSEHVHFGGTLIAGAFVLISLLCCPFQLHADTVRFFKITFEGTGTYRYYSTTSDGFYSDTAMNFNWHNVVQTAFSEDNASSPDTWGDLGFNSEPIVNVSGAFTYKGTDHNGYHNCSRGIASAAWPSIAVMKALEPGYLFVAAPFGDFFYQDPFCILDTGPFWSGDVLSSSFVLPPDALAQGKIIQYVSGNKPLTDLCDGCSSSVEWNGTVTFEKLAEYTVPSTPHPAGGYSFSYAPVNTPTVSSNPAMAEPVGLGPAADGGNTLDLNVGFYYPDPVDLYLALYAPSLSPDIWLIGPGPSAQPATQGLLKWKGNVRGFVEETVFGNIPVDALAGGTYTFYLVATPPNSTASFYLWDTQFNK